MRELQFPNDNIKIQRAYEVMEDAHGDQVRKDGVTPYIHHPIRVAKAVWEEGMDADEVVVALLHDVLEDTGYPWYMIYEEFGGKIAGMVDLLSKPGPEGMPYRHKQYIARLKLAPQGCRRVKWADIMDNLGDLETVDDWKFRNYMIKQARDYAGEVFGSGSFAKMILTKCRELEKRWKLQGSA